MIEKIVREKPWARSNDGVFFGVCRGIAERFDVSSALVRLALIFSVLFFGTGLLFYFMLVLSMPREDRIEQSLEKKVLGVCLRLSSKLELDVVLVRFFALFTLFFTGGVTLLFYVLLHFILDPDSEKIN